MVPASGPDPGPVAAPPGTRLLLAAVLLAALNLRGAIAAVGPVLGDVRADLDLSAATAGLLTTLPVLCFALLAPACAAAGRRVGPGPAVLASLVLLAAAQVLRVLDGAPVLLAGTFLAGAGMTVGNVLLPSVVKAGFGRRAGPVTGLYTAALVAGAAATAALTAPLAGVLGWRGALAAEGALAVLAAAVWAVAARRAGALAAAAVPGARPAGTGPRLWRSPVAWAVTAVQALHSTLYFSLTAWLPTLLADRAGTDLAAGSLAASVYQASGIAGSLLVPAVLARRPGQTGLALGVAGLWVVPVAGLLLLPVAWPAWAVVAGLAQGAGIALAVTLVVLRAADAEVAGRLSGMSQLVGYSVGAAGPVAVGALSGLTGGWTAPLLLLAAVTLGLALAGAVAARPVRIG
ncbi:CP family cyanate transporter-like MFS transporter [Geodermatophilus tzadiensis]|uniref:CP family cyanate transporter-like MFS transporter n=1 Tax=Geodermatophilus tzadiensis TaxID=1137988 RepID=A0A2T0TVT4_9ACTN|nr:MFS transporter [Geodermatophilus tzadiensis]PRY49794.1 CP family cyanate transporter-like MFS transporter [Geodermatophilus tzadiensis]